LAALAELKKRFFKGAGETDSFPLPEISLIKKEGGQKILPREYSIGTIVHNDVQETSSVDERFCGG